MESFKPRKLPDTYFYLALLCFQIECIGNVDEPDLLVGGVGANAGNPLANREAIINIVSCARRFSNNVIPQAPRCPPMAVNRFFVANESEKP